MYTYICAKKLHASLVFEIFLSLINAIYDWGVFTDQKSEEPKS